MFFRIDACPIEAASAIHFCASGGKDHRTCCGRNGVGATEAGARCFLFCDEVSRFFIDFTLNFSRNLEIKLNLIFLIFHVWKDLSK